MTWAIEEIQDWIEINKKATEHNSADAEEAIEIIEQLLAEQLVDEMEEAIEHYQAGGSPVIREPSPPEDGEPITNEQYEHLYNSFGSDFAIQKIEEYESVFKKTFTENGFDPLAFMTVIAGIKFWLKDNQEEL